jgi:hypothetical protein
MPSVFAEALPKALFLALLCCLIVSPKIFVDASEYDLMKDFKIKTNMFYNKNFGYKKIYFNLKLKIQHLKDFLNRQIN